MNPVEKQDSQLNNNTMANLTYIEKKRLESLFVMSAGFVMNFSNYEFRNFIQSSVRLDIYDSKYELGSGSKANRLRKFWDIESNQIVSKLLTDFAKYWDVFYKPTLKWSEAFDADYQACFEVCERLRDTTSDDIEAIKPNINDEDFEKLALSIREGLKENEPATQIDRLHTFLSKYVRVLCNKKKIRYDNSKPLNSIFGEYVKHLKKRNLVESEMTLKILSVTISVLEQFNDVRNNKSFAHPNSLLNNDESLLIFKYVSALIMFIDTLELKIHADKCLASQLEET